MKKFDLPEIEVMTISATDVICGNYTSQEDEL